jgi:hypothetical protein
MLKKLSLVALTGLITAGGAFATTEAPASADGLSVDLGVPGVFMRYDDYRYHHDRGYHEGYDRWRAERDRRDRDDRRHDDRRDWHHHDDRGR